MNLFCRPPHRSFTPISACSRSVSLHCRAHFQPRLIHLFCILSLDKSIAGCFLAAASKIPRFCLFRRIPALTASSFPRCRSCQYEHFPPTLPHGGATSGFQAFGGYSFGCVLKIGHSRDTRLTRVDGRFSAAPVGTLPTAFGCVPAHTLRPALQAFARKTAGWRTEWAGACTKGSRFACDHPA